MNSSHGASITDLTTPQTWLLMGQELFKDERPETDAARREAFATTFYRQMAQTLVVTYNVAQSLDVLDARIDRGDVRWVYVSEGKLQFRFAALSVPVIENDRQQELAAVAVVATRKYKTGRQPAVKAICRALQDVLESADHQRIWIELQHTSTNTEWPRFWMVFWSVGRGNPPAASSRPSVALEDILANPDDARVWTMEERAPS